MVAVLIATSVANALTSFVIAPWGFETLQNSEIGRVFGVEFLNENSSLSLYRLTL